MGSKFLKSQRCKLSGLIYAPARSYSSAQPSRVLLRDFIHEQLYGEKVGYFNQSRPPVAPLSSPLEFSKFLGKADYLSALDAAYKEHEVAWLTPSEIFTPYYGQAVASYILGEQRKQVGSPLRIFELGGGTGTLAKDVLDHIKKADEHTYESCQYISCEISPVLAQHQRERVANRAGHESCYRVELRDAAERESWEKSNLEPCFILGMEVLDNCAHDKVVRGRDGSWAQEEVDLLGEKPCLVEAPLSDPIIKSVLQCALECEVPMPPLWERLYDLAVGYPSKGPYSREMTIFLPTKAALLLKTLQSARPNHQILIADFTHLPDTVIPGRLAPLVASKEYERGSVDYNSYLINPGTADIFFPTDFDLLCNLYTNLSGGTARTVTTSDFMAAFAEKGATATRNGYNPILEDFSNTAFFMGQSQAK